MFRFYCPCLTVLINPYSLLYLFLFFFFLSLLPFSPCVLSYLTQETSHRTQN